MGKGSKNHNYTDSKGENHRIFESTDGEGGRMYPQTADGKGMGAASESLKGAEDFIEEQIEKENI